MNRHPRRYRLLYLWTLPFDLLTWAVVMLIWLLWGTKLTWYEGLWCRLKPNSWPTRTWYRIKDEKGAHIIIPPEYQEDFGRWRTWGGTTIGHGGFFGPIPVEKTKYHEHVHVEQFECVMTMASALAAGYTAAEFFQGNMPSLYLVGCLWLLPPVLLTMSAWFVAWLRGEDPYRGSSHEESAYALTAQYIREKEGIE